MSGNAGRKRSRGRVYYLCVEALSVDLVVPHYLIVELVIYFVLTDLAVSRLAMRAVQQPDRRLETTRCRA